VAKKKNSFGDSPVGSGGRFAECVRTMRRRKNVEDPEGLCASIGRKKYGKRRFQEMAAKGRRNPSHGDPSPSARFALLDKNDSELYWVQDFWEIQENDDTGEVIEAARISWRKQGPHEVIPGGDWVLVPWDMIRGKYPGQYAKLYKNPSHSDAQSRAEEHLWEASVSLAKASLEMRNTGRWWIGQSISAVRKQVAEIADSLGQSGGSAPEVEHQEENPLIEAGPVANPVKADGKWHRETTGERVTLYGMQTAKGLAWVVPYKPRKSRDARDFAAYYEQDRGRKIPKGTKWMTALVSGVSVTNITAHKTLDDAKRAGENALRKLPMPNPAPRLVNEGLLAGSRPIPSGLDSPRYNEGILAGSRPIPSGLGSPRVNVGIVDPPITRRSKPEQPF
jgi:hypothetical protein